MELDRKRIKSDSHGEALLRGAKCLRDEGKFFDFTIIVDGTRFAAHKLILSASSDFFRAIFQHPESIEYRTNECCLKDITPVAMEAVLEFCYTAQIELDIESAQEILMVASILQINTLQSLCNEYVIKHIDAATNCLSLLTLADRFNLPTLVEQAVKLCLDNDFDAISKEEEFLQLDKSLLFRLISHDHLSVAKEESVLSAVLNWMAADKGRAQELDNLLSHVRFVFFDPRNLFDPTWPDDHRATKSDKFRELVEEAKYYHTLAEFPEQRSEMVGKRFEPRYQFEFRRQQRIFVVNRNTGTADLYDPYLDKWVDTKTSMSIPMGGGSMTILNDCLYVVGGIRQGSYLKNVERYDIKTGAWQSEVAEMNHGRAGPGLCVWDGHLYAIGGVNEEKTTDVVERYRPRTNTWEECMRIRQKRKCHQVTVCNGSIYVLGGSSEARRTNVINTVERFDAVNNEWSFVAPMTTGRSFFGCTTFEGKIYVVGGEGDLECDLDTGECYDPVEDRWEPIPSIGVKWCFLKLIATNGLLYALGGYNSVNPNLVKAYDPEKKEWTTKSPRIHPALDISAVLYSPMKQQLPSNMI